MGVDNSKDFFAMENTSSAQKSAAPFEEVRRPVEGQQDELRKPIEAWRDELATKNQHFRAVRVLMKWPLGRLLTQAEYEGGLEDLKHHTVRGH